MSNFTPRNPHSHNTRCPHNRRREPGTSQDSQDYCDSSEHEEHCPNHPRNQHRHQHRCHHVNERRNTGCGHRHSQPIASATYNEHSIEGILRSQPTFPPKYTESLMDRLEEAYWDNWKPPKLPPREGDEDYVGPSTGRAHQSLWGPQVRRAPQTRHQSHPRHEIHSHHEHCCRHKSHPRQEPQPHHEPQSRHEPQPRQDPQPRHKPQPRHVPQFHHEPQLRHEAQTRREVDQKKTEEPHEGQNTEVTYYAGSNFRPSSVEESDLNTDAEPYHLVEMSSQEIQTDDTPSVASDNPTETETEIEMKVIKETKERHKKVIDELKALLLEKNKVEPTESTSIENADIAGPSGQSREGMSEPKASTQQMGLRLTRRSTGFLRGGTYPLQSNKKDTTPMNSSFRLGPPGGTLFMTSYSYNKKYNK